MAEAGGGGGGAPLSLQTSTAYTSPPKPTVGPSLWMRSARLSRCGRAGRDGGHRSGLFPHAT